jgi:hypothetical protein
VSATDVGIIVGALAALTQAIIAVMIWRVTSRYVTLTAEIKNLQAEVVALQKQGVKRELYGRRLEVYDRTMAFLAACVRDFRIDWPELIQFLRDTRDAEFLFEKDVVTFLGEVYRNASKHRTVSRARDQQSRQEDVDRLNEIESWLATTAVDQAKTTFGRYLRVADEISATA